MAYFAALLRRSADRWQARDADLDEIEDIAGLVEFMREVPDDEEDEEPDTTVLLLEQEEVWFAVVRLDAEEDPRVFVSDVAACSRSAYGELLLSVGLAAVGPDGEPDDEQDLESGEADDEESGPPELDGLAEIEPDKRRPLPSGPAGDALLLEDFDVPAAKLARLCRAGLVPADALADVAEALGAAEELEEVR